MVQDNPPAMTLVPPPVGRAARLDGIDTLRGLSIIAVVLHHINLRMMFNGLSFESFLPTQLGKALFWNGANGVTVFFAISGFLITTNSLRRWGGLEHVRVFDFYRLRFARIVPLLVALLLLLSALHLAHAKGFVIPPERATLGRALLAATTFHVNWLEATRGYLPASWDVLWSLSVEEMFYIFFPLVCLSTRVRAVLIPVLLLFVVLGPFARTVLTHNGLWADIGYLSCMDGIALGCLAALAANVLRLSSALLWTLRVTGTAMVMLVMLVRPLTAALRLYKTGLDVTVLALGTCLLLVAIAQRNNPGGRPTAAIRWFGRNSYEIYLTHMFVVLWSVQLFVATGTRLRWAPLWYLAMLGAAGLVGAIVATRYSEPMNRRLRRARPSVRTA
jgi:peptidoglycan/LPS O-acetylase OafA/YrhL